MYAVVLTLVFQI